MIIDEDKIPSGTMCFWSKDCWGWEGDLIASYKMYGGVGRWVIEPYRPPLNS